MRSRLISRMLGSAKRNPLSFIFAVLISGALIVASCAVLAFFLFGLYFPGVFCDKIAEKTGFSMNPQDSFVNIYTGECVFRNLVIENSSGFGDSSFINAPYLRLKISFFDFFAEGVLRIKSFDCHIGKLSCIINIENDYNLRNFISGMRLFTEPYPDGLEYVRVKIDSYDYKNITEADSVQWQNDISFDFSCRNLSVDEFWNNFNAKLDSAGASFISKAFGFSRRVDK